MFTSEQKINAYKKLPGNIKDFLGSDDFTNIIKDIGKTFNLLIDKEGMLGNEILLVALGLVRASDFPLRIKHELGIADDKENLLLQAVNAKVFSKIRGVMQNTVIEQETSEEIPNPEREQIIQDIENPSPTPETKVAPITDPRREIESRSATDNFIASKVGNTNVSSNETDAVKVQPQNLDLPAQTEKKYVADPYREPIN